MDKNDENSNFNRALRNFTFDVAVGGGIRHLYKLGLSAEEIQKELAYPLPLDRIEREIAAIEKE
ncbi:MAG: hypothetical protein K5686_08195 [Lachnospiraceae bacterium]|nr:hypothetical protein [Lachnospiraceae bacterium]